MSASPPPRTSARTSSSKSTPASPTAATSAAAAAAAPSGTGRGQLQVVQLSVDLIDGAPWNANRVPADVMHKLEVYIRKEGLVQPLVVRPYRAGRYQMIGGHHRLEVCRDRLGWREVPAVVVDVDEKRAKVMSINLNELSGDPVPQLLAELVHDLGRDTSLDDLSTMLPYSTSELRDFEELLKLPDGLDAFIEDEAEKQAREAPKVLSFVVDEPAAIERAVEHIVAGLQGKNRRGRALVTLAEAYLDANGIALDDAPSVGDNAPGGH